MEESFVLEHQERKKMSPIAKMAKFVFDASITIVVLLCAAWLVITIHFFVTYGPLEAVTFALGSLALISLIYGMKHHRR